MRRGRRAGLTLVDVMVGFAVSAVVIAAAIQLFITLVAGGARVHAHLDITTEMRTVEVRLRRDIATALAAGKVDVDRDGKLVIEQIKAGKPGAGFDSEEIAYEKKDGPGGAHLTRNGKAVSKALLRACSFERVKGADDLLHISYTLADPDRPIEVHGGFVISTVPVLRARRDGVVAPAPAAAGDQTAD